MGELRIGNYREILLQQFLITMLFFLKERAEDNSVDGVAVLFDLEPLSDYSTGHMRGVIQGVAEDTGTLRVRQVKQRLLTNSAQGNWSDTVLLAQGKDALITVFEVFFVFTSGANGVQDILGY